MTDGTLIDHWHMDVFNEQERERRLRKNAVAWAAIVKTDTWRIEDFTREKCREARMEPTSVVFPVAKFESVSFDKSFGLMVNQIGIYHFTYVPLDDTRWIKELPKGLHFRGEYDPARQYELKVSFDEAVYFLGWQSLGAIIAEPDKPSSNQFRIVRGNDEFIYADTFERVAIICATEAEARAWAKAKTHELLRAHKKHCRTHNHFRPAQASV